MAFHPALLLSLAFLATVLAAPVRAQTALACLPEERGSVELSALRPGYFTVAGRLGGFDPCEASVKFRVPSGPAKPRAQRARWRRYP